MASERATLSLSLSLALIRLPKGDVSKMSGLRLPSSSGSPLATKPDPTALAPDLA